MNEIISLDIVHFLLLIVPGFFLVWSYNKAKKKKIENNFEYTVLSFFFGLATLSFWAWIFPEQQVKKMFFENIYAGTLSLSVINIFTGSLIGGRFNKYLDRFVDSLIKE